MTNQLYFLKYFLTVVCDINNFSIISLIVSPLCFIFSFVHYQNHIRHLYYNLFFLLHDDSISNNKVVFLYLEIYLKNNFIKNR